MQQTCLIQLEGTADGMRTTAAALQLCCSTMLHQVLLASSLLQSLLGACATLREICS